jgi:hypothetical protein
MLIPFLFTCFFVGFFVGLAFGAGVGSTMYARKAMMSSLSSCD